MVIGQGTIAATTIAAQIIMISPVRKINSISSIVIALVV